MSILKETIRLLKKADLTEIAKETGYSYQWLWQVKTGKTENPSFKRIEKLHKHLSK